MSTAATGTYPIPIDLEAIKAYCEKYGIREFALFGSVLRDDFDDESDVDVLLEFEEGRGFTFLGLPEMIDEIESQFGRPVHLVDKKNIRNPFMRRSILSSYEVVHAS